MIGILAEALGGMIPIFLLTLLFRKFVIKDQRDIGKALLPVGLAYAATVVIAGFGMADGGPPKFGQAAFVYGISALAVGLLVAIGFSRKASEVDSDG